MKKAPPIKFTKMHGLGNDFVVINTLNQSLHFPLPIKRFANRNTGIGFDQLLLIEKSNTADFFCRIFNADGTEAEQCGNGLRCVARFIHENKLTTTNDFNLETITGVFNLNIENYNHISVNMGKPKVLEKLVHIPVTTNLSLPISIVSMGNPHAIVFCPDDNKCHPEDSNCHPERSEGFDSSPSAHNDNLEQYAQSISNSSYFSHGANVGFMQVKSKNHIALRTIERGSGETYACGSNACAAVMAGIVNERLANSVDVEYRYGQLAVRWDPQQENILMTGPAEKVYSGEIVLEIATSA